MYPVTNHHLYKFKVTCSFVSQSTIAHIFHAFNIANSWKCIISEISAILIVKIFESKLYVPPFSPQFHLKNRFESERGRSFLYVEDPSLLSYRLSSLLE